MLLKIENLTILSKEYLGRYVLNIQRFNKLKSAEIYSFVNPFSYFDLQKNANRYSITGFFIDGILLSTALTYKYSKTFVRASFDYGSVAPEILQFAALNELRVGIIGSNPTEISIAVSRIRNRYLRHLW